MPQWRKLHSKITDSIDVNEMPDDFTRLLWTWLPLALDREGRGMYNPAWVKAKVMPLRMDVSYDNVQAALQWFRDHEMIIVYQVKGTEYFYAPSFKTYQGNTSKEAASNFPAPPDLLQSNSGVSPDLLPERSITDADADAEEEKKDIAPPVDEMLEMWRVLFPKKPQPKPSTYRDKIKARWKDPDFREKWKEALEAASQSPTLQAESWFNFEFFVRNEKNYQNMLNRWMEWKDKERGGYAPKPSAPSVQQLGYIRAAVG